MHSASVHSDGKMQARLCNKAISIPPSPRRGGITGRGEGRAARERRRCGSADRSEAPGGTPRSTRMTSTAAFAHPSPLTAAVASSLQLPAPARTAAGGRPVRAGPSRRARRPSHLVPVMATSTSGATASATPGTHSLPPRALLCTSLTASTVDGQLHEVCSACAQSLFRASRWSTTCLTSGPLTCPRPLPLVHCPMQMKAAKEAGADLAEVRVDLLSAEEQPGWERLLREKVLPVIVTNRAAWEGGRAPVGEPTRLEVLTRAAKAGADFIDVELAAFDEFKRLFGATGIPAPTRLILSHHNFHRPLSLDEIRRVYRRMVDADADVCKIAMAAKSATDNALAFFALREAKDRPMIMLVMGELGQCSRILAPKYGSFLTYASVGDGREAAPGQVATDALTGMYRFRSITASTGVYGVIGNPVSHSMSPAVHNAAFADAGIDAVYVPLKVDDDVAVFIRTMHPQGFAGFSVTIPSKVPSLEAMDEVEEVTSKIGAMNTVVTKSDGQLLGCNTDWVAAISAIQDGLEQRGRVLADARVLCIGAGGAARGLAYGALARGAAHVVIANRTLEKAQALAQDIGDGASAQSIESLCADSDRHFDVIMNTTSVGMHPRVDESPLPGGASRLEAFGRPLVFDAVYNPLETTLLREAGQAGCACVSGVEMFVRQAAEQFRLWFPETEPNVALMRQVVMDRLNVQ
jgi:3-dehydroquinate dehydratase / shikimate dehydrogenase